MEHLDGILKLVEAELIAINNNGKFRSREEIDSVYKLIDIVKDVYCIWDYEDEMDGESYGGMRSYRYGDSSYARGRKRDSMGRYSREYRGDQYRDYSRDSKDEYREHLMMLMDKAPDENARQSIKRMLDSM